MAKAILTEPMIRQVLSAESSPQRFERFCIALYTEVDSRTYVGTSQSYDQGRDARGAYLANGEPPPIICVSLRKDVLDKASEDAMSVSKTSKPAFLRFCSNQELSERLLDRIENIFREMCNDVKTVIADGLIQIVQFAVQHPKLVEDHYPGEVANLRSALAVTESDTGFVQLTGLRIALTTQVGEDAASLREDVQKNLVLTSLSDGRHRTLGGLAALISQLLHLSRPPRSEYLSTALDNLMAEKQIETVGTDQFCITDAGREQLKLRSGQGAARLGEGQDAVKASLQELCGEAPDSVEFAKLWNVFQDAVANMFLANGIYIVDSVASVINRNTQIADHPNLQEGVESLSHNIASLDIWGPRAAEISQAIRDMFSDHTSSAFTWLADICLVYVSVCSLGLERSSQDQVVARLREMDLLLDTDVVLSYLCKGESNHGSVTAILEGWRKIQGRVYVSKPVLEETAYHAFIATRDYDAIWRRLGQMSDRDALRLIINAFVRSFRIEAQGKYERKRWGYYIDQFAGSTEYDFRKIQEVLLNEGIEFIPDDGIDRRFADEVSRSLQARDVGDDDDAELQSDEFRDKCNRDGRLVAVLQLHRRNRAEVGGTAIIVSSSRLLKAACPTLGSQLGPPEVVLPIGAVAYLLSLVPGVNLSLGSLRGVLFDVDYRAKLPPLDRLVIRIIDASEEYMMPFARRARLKPILRDKIGRLARERGQKPKDIIRQIRQNDEAITKDFAGAVAAAVDEIARSEAEKGQDRAKRRA